METPERDLVSVQMLRAIAASMVVLVHLDVQLTRLNYPVVQSGWLATGVDIFFVISGFIMWMSVERHGNTTALSFMRNRVVRIVPLYWTITGFLLLVATITPQLLRTTVVRPLHVVDSFLFLPARHPTTNQFWPFVIPGWSLNYEMLFYVLFALAIAVSRGNWKVRLLFVTGSICAILAVAGALKDRIDVMNFYAKPIMLEFVLGILLAIAWASGAVKRAWYWAPLVPIGFVSMWAGAWGILGFAGVAGGATMIVAGAIFLPPLKRNLLSSLGDASYSLYLTHPFSLAAATLVWTHLGLEAPPFVFLVGSLVCAIGLALLAYNWIELPMGVALKSRAKNEFRTPSSEHPLNAALPVVDNQELRPVARPSPDRPY